LPIPLWKAPISSTAHGFDCKSFEGAAVELNAKGRYAVMAMADLARNGAGGAIALSGIAERQKISPAYLEQIFLKLRRAGLVESERGRSGGYRLARPAAAIAVGDVMIAAEEPVEMTRCAGEGFDGCIGHERCLTHDLWDALSNRIRSYLQEVSLQDVIDGRVRREPLQ
jgi:Rrf2 family iron-sulfur cluster assembly transcriptional regulator